MPTEFRKIAIVHDWLVSDRGGEKVLGALLELFPNADLFTLFHTPGAVPYAEKNLKYVSPLNRLPFVDRYYRYLLPLLPAAVEAFPVADYDLVISSSHCVAKGIIPGPSSLHVCYCHTPMRYAWDRYEDYFGGPYRRYLFLPFFHRLRQWDVTSSHRVDRFIANSQWTAKRIEKYYRRKAQVVTPFVDAQAFGIADDGPSDYYLVVAGFAPYKRIDLAIEACQRMGRELVVVGDGQNSRALRLISQKTTHFLGKVSDEELQGLYSKARALLFPGEEDFGITPLESMASGRPVIAFGQGGVTESVIEGETGIFFRKQTVEGLVEAISHFEAKEKQFVPARLRARAQQFSKERFQTELTAAILNTQVLVQDNLSFDGPSDKRIDLGPHPLGS